MKVHFEGLNEVVRGMDKLADADFGNACKSAATDIYNMGQTRTPKDTGELRTSLGVNRNSATAYEVGYAKEYAPHVEYGHRLVRNGSQVGYVEGQYYLRAMVEDEAETFKEYIKKELTRK